MFNRKNLNTAFGFLSALFVTSAVFAQEHVATATTTSDSAKGILALAAGLGIAIASFGGALGQGRAIASAMEGIARNPGSQPKVFIPMLIGLALVESLVILAFVVCYGIAGKI